MIWALDRRGPLLRGASRQDGLVDPTCIIDENALPASALPEPLKIARPRRLRRR